MMEIKSGEVVRNEKLEQPRAFCLNCCKVEACGRKLTDRGKESI